MIESSLNYLKVRPSPVHFGLVHSPTLSYLSGVSLLGKNITFDTFLCFVSNCFGLQINVKFLFLNVISWLLLVS